MLYAALFRLWDNRKQTIQTRKNEKWYGPLFSFLDGDIKPDEFQKLVSKSDFPYFIEFMKEFFLDLAGNEKELLRQLLIQMELDHKMIKQLSARNSWKRMYAIYFLGLMDCQKAVLELRQKIYDKSEVVRMLAISTLMQLRDLESLPTILDHLNKKGSKENQSQITEFLMEFGTAILPHLESAFINANLKDWIKQVCIDVFGHFVYIEMTNDLVSLYRQTNNIEVKTSCVAALGKFEDPSLCGFFEQVLDNPHQAIRVHAIKALGKLGSETSLPRLEKLSQDQDFWVAKRSIEALIEYGPDGIDRLNAILKVTQTELTHDLITETLYQNPNA